MTAKTIKTTKTDAETREFTDADFDAWTQEAETAAIEAIAAASQIRYIVVEGTFVGRFPDGTILRTPVRFNTEDLDKVSSVAGDSELDQVRALFSVLGDKEALSYLEGADLVSATDYAKKYLSVFARVMGVALGE